MKRSCLLLSLVALACAPEDATGGMFATAPNGSASVTASGTLSAGTETDVDSDADSEPDGDTTTGTADTTSGPGTGTTEDPTSATEPTTGASTTAAESGDTTDSGGGMGQPANGMYSHCTLAANTCGPSPATCIDITGADNGYCSVSPCTTPAVDCDPTPAGGSNAPPICIMAQDAMMAPIQFCALDCSAAQICPLGMICVPNLMFAEGLPSYSICV